MNSLLKNTTLTQLNLDVCMKYSILLSSHPLILFLFYQGNDGIPNNLQQEMEEILKRNKEFSTQENSLPLYRSRLMIIGKGGVGKTSLVHCLRNAPLPQQPSSTDSVELSEWKISLSQGETMISKCLILEDKRFTISLTHSFSTQEREQEKLIRISI